MKTHYHHRREVSFSDTDMAGIVHFTNYLKYLEDAEHAFLRSVGLSVVLEDERGKLGFPKLSAECRFLQPTLVDETVETRLSISCEDGKTVRYQGDIYRGEDRVASGELRVACCRFPVDGLPFAIPVPDDVLTQMFGVQV